MSQTRSVTDSRRLFLAGFICMIALGMGFAARAAVLGRWGSDYGFTRYELGVITGFGLTGFGLTVMFFSVLVERWGYGPTLAMTFGFHLLSGLVTLLAAPMFHSSGKDATFWALAIGTTLFAIANGAGEAAFNPLVAAIYPKERTHRLNMLHAGYPGGLVLGALAGIMLASQRWEVILLTYLVPTVIYGALMLGQRFPTPQAVARKVTVRSMAREFASPVFLLLLVLMAMVGFVELGTDSWISNITGLLLNSEKEGLYLFMWAAGLMFVLRFVAGPIVHRISPLGLLLVSACVGAIGLFFLSEAGGRFRLGGAVMAATIAVTIYGMGKTFFWPTMLGVAAERFPKGGALTIGALGCVGTLSAGLLGGPAIGFMQDRFASQSLENSSPAAYQRYQADKDNSFLFFHSRGLDGSKVAILTDNGEQLAKDLAALKKSESTKAGAEVSALTRFLRALHLARDEAPGAEVRKLQVWWTTARTFAAADRGPVVGATLYGSRMALRRTALVPVAMAAGYLLLLLYFRAKGGYRQLHAEAVLA